MLICWAKWTEVIAAHQIRNMLLMSILGCCLSFGWALTVAVVPFSHPHVINEGQVSGCIAAEREAGPLVGPCSSRTLPESTLLQLT